MESAAETKVIAKPESLTARQVLNCNGLNFEEICRDPRAAFADAGFAQRQRYPEAGSIANGLRREHSCLRLRSQLLLRFLPPGIVQSLRFDATLP